MVKMSNASVGIWKDEYNKTAEYLSLDKRIFELEVFDSKNTCRTEYKEFDSNIDADIWARELSKTGYGKVSVRLDNKFNAYENGELEAWSFPEGLTGYEPKLSTLVS